MYNKQIPPIFKASFSFVLDVCKLLSTAQETLPGLQIQYFFTISISDLCNVKL